MPREGQFVDTLAVIGVGLIGGSLAGALKECGAVGCVVGCGRSTENLEAAAQRGLIDRYTTDPIVAVAEADLVLLATPVNALIQTLPTLAKHVRPDAIITDAGSVKCEVINAARTTLGETFDRFVPGHPIAGREKSGSQAAVTDLFRDHWVVLTPLEDTDPTALALVRKMWEQVGSRVRLMDPASHDEILGMTSHLPHAVAYALVAQLGDQQRNDEYASMTAGGFLDITRVASSDPAMWRDIFLHNGETTADLIREHRKVLERLETLIREGNAEGLQEWFESAKSLRSSLENAKEHQRSKPK
jgi:prephenate dehydrogenase